MTGKQQTDSRLYEVMSRNSDLSIRIGQLEASLQEASGKMAQHQQTISLLVSEKTALSASLERLEQLEPSLSFLQVGHCSMADPALYCVATQELEGLLHTERTRSSSLEINVKQLEATLAERSTRVNYLSTQEKDLLDRCRERVNIFSKKKGPNLIDDVQEREIQLINGSLNDLQAESDRYRQKAQELEERIQRDDRVEKLEGVLQNTRDRADELDFQLSKVKQVSLNLRMISNNILTYLLIRLMLHSSRSTTVCCLDSTRVQTQCMCSRKKMQDSKNACHPFKANYPQ
jgi:DNA repair exonuclease SbcCD ATPase subunit